MSKQGSEICVKCKSKKDANRRCKVCFKDWSRRTLQAYKNRTADEIKQAQAEKYPSGKKQCTGCKKDVKLSEFGCERSRHDGLTSKCASCTSEKLKIRQTKRRRVNTARTDEEINKKQKMEAKQSAACTECKQEKPFSEFYRAKKERLGIYSRCKVCITKRQYCINQFKENKVCQDCGYAKSKFLMFCYRDSGEKLRTSSGRKMGMCGLKWKTREVIIEEMKKCDLLCANCVYVKHYKEKFNEDKKENEFTAYLWRIKQERKECVDCHVSVGTDIMRRTMFHFDHRPGTTKVDNLSQMSTYTKADVIAELAKVDLRCARCHFEITCERRDQEQVVQKMNSMIEILVKRFESVL